MLKKRGIMKWTMALLIMFIATQVYADYDCTKPQYEKLKKGFAKCMAVDSSEYIDFLLSDNMVTIDGVSLHNSDEFKDMEKCTQKVFKETKCKKRSILK